MDDQGSTEDTQATEGAEPRTSAWGRALTRGDSLGRYLIVDVVGSGAMGVVYAAYDPDLDRKIALKLLHRRPGDDADARAGLVREAKAMAKVVHTNVVSVFDVAEADQSVFVAMEYIAGQTLQRWLEEPRSTDEIVAMFTEAGRGLAAAHAVGLVHRDFKPGNVMVTETGRVVVVDFGLAHVTGESDASARRGRPSGTPAFMSPEQVGGEPSDARTDQFSFCVALYRALYREAPFPGDTAGEIFAAVLDGSVAKEPKKGTVPRRLRGVLLRGLARNAADRFESMPALLEALHRATAPRRRGVLAGAVVVIVGLGIALGSQPEPVPDYCATAGDAMDAVWNEERRSAVESALVESAVQDAEAWRRVGSVLSDHAEKWREEQHAVCREALSPRVAAPVSVAKRKQCLDEGLQWFDAVTVALSRTDRASWADAVTMVTSLSPPTDCRDPAVVSRLPPTPADEALREPVFEARAQLKRVYAEVAAGRMGKATEEIEALQARVASVGYPELELDVATARVHVYAYSGKLEPARELALEVIEEATRRGRTDLLVNLLGDAARISARADNDAKAFEVLFTLARATAERAHWPTEIIELDLLYASILRRGVEPGDLEASLEVSERALENALENGRAAEEIEAFVQVGASQGRLGKALVGIRYLERALALADGLYGSMHPHRAVIALQLARVCLAPHDVGRARALLEGALDTFDAAYPEPPVTALAAMGALSAVLLRQGETDDAIALTARAYERGLEMFERPHRDLVIMRRDYTTALRRGGRVAEALALSRESLDDAVRIYGPEAGVAVHQRITFADSLRSVGKCEEALGEYRRAIELGLETYPVEGIELPRALAGGALCKHALEDRNGAVLDARRAHALAGDSAPDAEDFAITRYVLAYILRLQGQVAEANEIGRELAVALRSVNDAGELSKSLDRWLTGEDVLPVY